MRVVMKFGGTSVGDVPAIKRLVDIVRREAERHEVIVVVSAVNARDLRTTDRLVSAARAAMNGDPNVADRVPELLMRKYLQLARGVAEAPDYEELQGELQDILDRLSDLLQAVFIVRELTNRVLDEISGQGERASARLVAAALRSAGQRAEVLDATGLIVTDDEHGDATALMEQTREQARGPVLAVLEKGHVPVVTGFIGATRENVPTTLGRGGSDYSAAVLGAALDAGEVWFWKEVDGVMSGDPRVVPDARTLPVLSYTEAAELAYYGAGVLHPRTVHPLVERRIPIRIRNSFNPENPGTLIGTEAVAGTAKAVTAIKDVSLITIRGPGMLGLRGVAARIFTAVAQAGANVLLITQASSEQNVSLAVLRRDAKAALRELRRELAGDLSGHDVEHVDVLEPVEIVAVVGSGMRGTPGIAGKLFAALGADGINVIAIAQGSTEYNISFVVAGDEGDRAVRVVHRAFGLGSA